MFVYILKLFVQFRFGYKSKIRKFYLFRLFFSIIFDGCYFFVVYSNIKECCFTSVGMAYCLGAGPVPICMQRSKLRGAYKISVNSYFSFFKKKKIIMQNFYYLNFIANY